VIAARGLEEVSIGDYILSGGEVAATVLDAVVRLIPGVMGKLDSGTEESFETGLLEYPHYTRPRAFRGRGHPRGADLRRSPQDRPLAPGAGPAP
jgi:tRNA (guanine37-N1)-methyltransferase